ncbi:MAG: hypothetical protein NTV46_04040 [Verrucomicrobia bacterium]|nr:hypothetical protein [Verrucomicrobiota bacterium]
MTARNHGDAQGWYGLGRWPGKPNPQTMHPHPAINSTQSNSMSCQKFRITEKLIKINEKLLTGG